MHKLLLAIILVLICNLPTIAAESETGTVQQLDQAVGNTVAPEYVVDEKDYGDFKITCYVMKKDKRFLSMVAETAGEAYGLCTKLFGKNQFVDIIVREVSNLNNRGLNYHNGTIELDDTIFNDRESIKTTLVHEICHFWHINIDEMWLADGMSTFFPFYMTAKRMGFPEEDNYFSELNIICANPNYSKVVKDTPLSYYTYDKGGYDIFGPDGAILVYRKGGYVMEMLRQTLGDDLFFKAARKFYAEYDIMTTRGFEQAVNEVTGKNYHWFFEQWVYKVGYPYLIFNYEIKDNILKVKITQKKGLFRLPLPLIVKTAKGKKTFTLDLSKKEQSWDLKVSEKALNVSLDPYHHFLKFVEGSGDDFAAQGEEAFSARDYEKAQMFFSKALSVEPEHLGSLFGRVKVYIKLNNLQAAEKTFQQILKLEPENLDALSGLAEVFQNSGNSLNSQQVYEKILRIIQSRKNVVLPSDIELMVELIPGKIALLKGENEKAVDLFSKSIVSWEERPEIRLLRAQANLNLGRTDAVWDDCEYLDGIQAQLTDEQVAKLDLLFARAFDLLGKREDAITRYKEILDLNADGADIAAANAGINKPFK